MQNAFAYKERRKDNCLYSKRKIDRAIILRWKQKFLKKLKLIAHNRVANRSKEHASSADSIAQIID